VSIFDEVITGFRIAPGGAREHYDVQPDLSCYGKALGNGMPISAVAGSWAAMRPFEDVFFSGTHGGETLSLAAARAVLDTVADGAVLAGIADRGRCLASGFHDVLRTHDVGARLRVGGHPSRTVIAASGPDRLAVRSWVQQCMLDRGVLFNGSMFVSARHSEADVDAAIRAFADAARGLAETPDIRTRLRGEVVQEVFRQP
jgi:glutamate-1-semialdehyde aminotransferase